MADFSKLKLGKLPPKLDPRTLRLAKYLSADLPAPPDSVDWTAGIKDWGMLGNDVLGDCTVAAVAHAVQVWMANVGWPWDPSVDAAEVIKYYSWWAGYNPADPSSDQGAVELNILNDWRKMDYAGHKLLSYADPDPLNHTHVQQSIALFGGVYIGLALPFSAQSQEIWDVVGDPTKDPDSMPGSWGGHAVYVPAYKHNTEGHALYRAITWGQLIPITERFWNAYVDETHTLLGGMFLEKNVAPSGFGMTALEADLAEVTA